MSRSRESTGGSSTPLPGAVASTSVQVAVRIRPVTSADHKSIPARWQRSILTPSSANSVTVETGSAPPGGPTSNVSVARDKRQAFSFDRVFAPTEGQADIFTVAEPLIERFIEGYNVTILAYGQTSSGKSYTMGTAAWDDLDYEGLVAGRQADPQMGIIPRAVSNIFAAIKRNQSTATQYSVKVSFIEIYNEDLIDLLAGVADADQRPHVQIREGKNGQIIWSGLREVKVTNVAQVMNHLLQGSSVRRTNETDMNAQSSRSHAIFSITLVQRKWAGSGPAPNSGRSTPLAGRVVSGLSRPSMVGRVASPSSLGRRTPSGIPGRSGRTSSAGLRPMSSMASDTTDESVEGEWVTLTSKFHFVDLAGSERLKRTAAHGDRVKEGISINSGLHALGNVISALGDPSKARRTTHIPYRDSKLTRLLQDSLGGNAHTLMIACVSPTEYNVSETVNTLQYANRARNIKNKAELNEVEVGWDDLDYLQTLVSRLRKELSIIKGATKGIVDLSDPRDTTRSAHKETLLWQDKYAILSQKHTQLTAQFSNLQSQLDPASQESEDAFYKAAEPIIVEYEKSIDALEGQINLLKAASAYLEDLANEKEAQIEQQSTQLEIIGQELEEQEAAVSDLQAKLTKAQERQTSADVYARELEGRLESIGQRGDTDAATLVDLHKEIARLKETQVTSKQYIADLEGKLASANEAYSALSAKAAELEADLATRDEQHISLTSRFDLLHAQNQAASVELDAKNKQLEQYEQNLALASSKFEDISSQHKDLILQHELLTIKSSEKEAERDELSRQVSTLKSAATAAVRAEAAQNEDDEPTQSADDTSRSAEALDARLQALQQEMMAVRDSESSIRAELEIITKKYKASLQEIKTLNTQLADLKLSGGLHSKAASAEEADEELEMLDTIGDENKPPPSDRSGVVQRRRRPESLLLDTTNRPNDAKRLNRRSSGSFLGYNPSDSPRAAVAGSPLQHVRTRSVSQSVLLSEAVAGLPIQTLTKGPRPLSLVGSVPSSPMLKTFEQDSAVNYERKLASLERETMRLQQALKERDEEIQALEVSVRTPRIGDTSIDVLPTSTAAADHTAMFDDLMRSMALKESQHREAIEAMSDELAKHKVHNATLETTPRDHVAVLTREIEQLKEQLVAQSSTNPSGRSLGDEPQSPSEAVPAMDDTTAEEHAAALLNLRKEHKTELDSALETYEAERTAMAAKHDAALQEVHTSLQEEHTRIMEQTSTQHQSQLEKLKQSNNLAIEEVKSQLEAQHSSTLTKVLAEAETKHRNEFDQALSDMRSVESERDDAHKAYEELHAQHLELLERGDANATLVETLRAEVTDTSDALLALEAALSEAQEERDQLLIDMETMRQTWEADAAAATSGDSTFSESDLAMKRELDTHKSMLSTMKGDMSRLKAELQTAKTEGARQTQTIKELQLRLTTSETRSIRSNGSSSFSQQSQSELEAAAGYATALPFVVGGRGSLSKASGDYDLSELRGHRPSLGAIKPPPPTPPPNMPPPPTPTGERSNGSIMYRGTGGRTSISSQVTRPESPPTGITRSSSVTSTHSPSHTSDQRLARLLTEQAEEIKSLVRQLNNGEADLQANIDLVATLEAALNDSERNLRKSRVQLAEVSRERERYLAEANSMRSQLNSAQIEVETVRNSVMLERRASKMEEERAAQEQARKVLEAKIEEAQSKRKSSKLFCM